MPAFKKKKTRKKERISSMSVFTAVQRVNHGMLYRKNYKHCAMVCDWLYNLYSDTWRYVSTEGKNNTSINNNTTNSL